MTIYDKAPESAPTSYGEWLTRTGDVFSPKIPNDEPLKLECQAFLGLMDGDGDARRVARGRAEGRPHARAPPGFARWLTSTRRRSSTRARCSARASRVLEHAVVGKQPTLSPRSTAKREDLPPARIGDGTVVSTGAIVFAGTTLGARVIVGDQACIRERVTLGDDVVVGRGSLVENDTTIGALTKIQADAYITAYSTLEDNVFIAPCVVTTNDNFMGRTERRHELIAGPTIRRGARVGGGAILCPGVEIGEEAFVGAGAVVTKDVPPRKIVVGNPARVLRDVADDELLKNQ